MQAPVGGETVSREHEFMVSRQTLHPMGLTGNSYAAGTLNERAMQGGNTGDDFGVTTGSNAEIDDLRRE